MASNVKDAAGLRPTAGDGIVRAAHVLWEREMRTFMSSTKGVSHSQDMKLYADANPEGAGACRRRT